jgi:hypothetical protein
MPTQFFLYILIFQRKKYLWKLKTSFADISQIYQSILQKTCHLKKGCTVDIYFIKKLKWNDKNSEILGFLKSEPNPIRIMKN